MHPIHPRRAPLALRSPTIARGRAGRSAGRTAGFTLIEVLVAIAILAVALAAGIGLVSQSINTSAGLRDRTLALWVAQDRLREHQLLRDWPSPDTRSGTSTLGGREWRWTEQVIATAMSPMRRIEIEVQDSEGRGTLAHLTGFLREPPATTTVAKPK